MQSRVVQSIQLYFETLAHRMSVVAAPNRSRPRQPRKKEISWQAVYYHWQKWNNAGCFEQIWEHSLSLIQNDLDCTYVNLNGTHTLAKRGGKSVAYQYRKGAKTSNILPISDANGFILASTGIVAGNRHDAFNLKATYKRLSKT